MFKMIRMIRMIKTIRMVRMIKMIKVIKMRMSRLVLTELVCWQLHRLLLALQPPPVIYRLVYSVSDPQIQIHKQRDTNTQIHGYKHLLRCGDCPGGHLTLESIMMETCWKHLVAVGAL